MRIIERYLVTEMLKALLLVGAALVVLFDLFTFLAEAEDIGDGTYDASDALLVTLYTTPARLADMVPFIGILGTVYALSLLTASHEVVALRASAISPRRIAACCVVVATIVGVVILLTDAPARALFAEATLLRMSESSETGKLIDESGLWLRDGETVVNIENLEVAGEPTGIRIFEFDDDGTLETYLKAQNATPQTAGHWTLHGVTEKAREQPLHITTSVRGEALWTPIWDPEVPMVELPVQSYTLSQLADQVSATSASIHPKANLSIELWKRLYTPLTVGAFALLGAALMLRARPRQGVGAGLVLGFALAFVIYIAGELIQNVGLLIGSPPWVTQALPAAVVVALATWILRAPR